MGELSEQKTAEQIRREERLRKYKRYSELRDERGYSDYRVGIATGIASAVFTEWKNGNYAPKIDKLMLIANLFNVEVTEFLE